MISICCYNLCLAYEVEVCLGKIYFERVSDNWDVSIWIRLDCSCLCVPHAACISTSVGSWVRPQAWQSLGCAGVLAAKQWERQVHFFAEPHQHYQLIWKLNCLTEILLLVYCPGSCSLIYWDLTPYVYQTIALTVFIWVFVGENGLHISSRKEYILLLDRLYFHICRFLWIGAFISCLIIWSFNLKPIRGTRFEFSNVEYCWSEN